jgi:thymidine kinase
MATDGWIELIVGPMFSGKSTELLRRIRRCNVVGRKALVIKYAKDTRYSKDKLATHDQQLWDAVAVGNLADVDSRTTDAYDVIGIDEGQFFPDIVPFCENAANAGKTVIVAALDGTFQRLPFGHILELIPKAESVTKLTAVCMICRKEAAFSKRISAETAVEVIGGSDKYIAACRHCYNK